MLKIVECTELMELENQVAKEIWIMLQKLKKYSLLTPKNQQISYNLRDTDIDPEIQRKILNKFEAEGILDIRSASHIPMITGMVMEMYGFAPFFYKVVLIDEPFEKTYKHYAELNGLSYELSAPALPYYDKIRHQIVLGKDKCAIPKSSNQAELCKALFALTPGNWLKENDIVDLFNKGKKSPRSFYDAVRAVNEKVRSSLSIDELLEYAPSQVRIRTELFQK